MTEANRNDGNTGAGNGTDRAASAESTATGAGSTAPGNGADRGGANLAAAESTAAGAGSTGAASTGAVVVIIPTYNESDNLEDIVSRTRRAVPDADILVVDDNSPDGTGDLAEKLALTDEHVLVLHRTQKAGLGAAYLAGFDWALDRGYGVLVEMDADGSHDPAELPNLLAALANADLVVGSRWVRGGTVRNWPRSREILSRGGNAYARIMLRLSVHDATGGYRAYRASTLRQIGLRDVKSQGYCFQIELTLRTVRSGLKVAEVPITFTERAKGTSKMNRAIVAEALWRVTLWSLTRRGRSSQP